MDAAKSTGRGQPLLVYGSGKLLRHHLITEYCLTVHPLMLNSGRQRF
ncbi:MAG: hypothetical protein ACRYFX_09540 [Janthinobacterium lividum]